MSPNKIFFKGLALISQIGISMLVPIFLCIYLGIKLDAWLQTEYIMLIFLVLGIGAAFRNVYHLTKSFYAKDKAREDEVLKHMEHMKREASTKAALQKKAMEQEFPRTLDTNKNELENKL